MRVPYSSVLVVCGVVTCAALAVESQTGGSGGNNAVVDTEAAKTALLAEQPRARLYESDTRTTRIYGAPLSYGVTPEDSAERFRQNHVGVFGVFPQDLIAGSLLADGRLTQPVMFNADTGTYKFTLVYYTQQASGIPVYMADLRLLVRNEPGFPLVSAANGLRDLSGFAVPENITPDPA